MQSEEELSRTRAGELVSQLTNWSEYHQLYMAMEIAPKESTYGTVNVPWRSDAKEASAWRKQCANRWKSPSRNDLKEYVDEIMLPR
ncbi:unnamed protein product [Heligmosomoides polygyrus]|uniref:ACB domain-containing protein n=1 Tax=Heligmosomoides polygyrus TaxID=6339 RepID=A0A183GTE2_HELPZ|nr:unnamed protein product [Heligmosomoides polygyrus]